MTKEVYQALNWKSLAHQKIPTAEMQRIDDGVEDAHKRIEGMNQFLQENLNTAGSQENTAVNLQLPEDLIERVKLVPTLGDGSKVADVVSAFNALHAAIIGADVDAESSLKE